MADSPSPGTPAPKHETFLINDPATLRAIAHPMRQQILAELVLRDHGRAADLAKELRQPANAVSFHLRSLAKAGLIVEAPEHARDRRDRVWKPVAETFEIDRKLPGSTTVINPLIDWLRTEFMAPADDADTHRQLAAGGALLTKDEAKQLSADLAAVLDQWYETALAARGTTDEAPRASYQVLLAIGPRRAPLPALPGIEKPSADGEGRP